MCGIVVLHGPKAFERTTAMLAKLHHRGPDDTKVFVQDALALGFCRLIINGDVYSGRQPYTHGTLIGAINGEIYNHLELVTAYGLEHSQCDTDTILPLFELLGSQIIEHLDGFYAAVIGRVGTQHVYCLRDHMGKKPLFVGRSRDEIFITSELKVMDAIDWFQPIPRGVSSVDLRNGNLTSVAEHVAPKPTQSLRSAFAEAVFKRLPAPDQPLGVFLSGGLDSSLVSTFVVQQRQDAIYFTLGSEGSPDRRVIEDIVSFLNLADVRTVELPNPARIPELIRRVVFATESYNPSIVSNGLATYLLAEAAHHAGIKVVLTGEGADELFGGYHRLRPDEPWEAIRNQLINDMHYTELRRLDLCCMAHSVEPRCPFLDIEVRANAERLEYDQMYSSDQNKVHLRNAFKDVLPQSVSERRKTSFDVGSGIRGLVIDYLRRNGKSEREELRNIWCELFSFDASEAYFHAYPTFDAIIDRRMGYHQ